MWWYSASAWEHHSLKHLKDNLPIHPDDPTVSQQFMGTSSDHIIPSTWRQGSTHEEEVRKQAEAAKQFFVEEQDPSQVSSPGPKMEGLRLKSLECQVPKCHIKQGPIKSSKKNLNLHQGMMMSRLLR